MNAERIEFYDSEFEKLFDERPAPSKSKALDRLAAEVEALGQLIDDVAHMSERVECMHDMMMALLAAQGIEVGEVADGH
jgi:hypothetical protein